MQLDSAYNILRPCSTFISFPTLWDYFKRGRKHELEELEELEDNLSQGVGPVVPSSHSIIWRNIFLFPFLYFFYLFLAFGQFDCFLCITLKFIVFTLLSEASHILSHFVLSCKSV